jgi:predicted secreted hydrolase
MAVKRKGSKKKMEKTLSCKNDRVVLKSKTKAQGVTISKGSKGKIVKQRLTPRGYPRTTVDFDKKGTVEVATSKLKCA